MSSLSRRNFKLIFDLCKRQPWLANKGDELEHILWEECDSEEKRSLVIELLDRFFHVSSEKYRELLDNLVDSIVEDPRMSDEETQIAAMAADSGSDSSQYLLYDLKPMFEKRGWRKYKSVNTFGKCFQTFNRNNKLKNIVLIDEFVGSGKTVISRVDQINRQFSGVDDINIVVRSLISSDIGMNRILERGIDFKSLVSLRRGISDFYHPNEVDKKISIMTSLEDLLSESFEGREMPRLGYGKTECLYFRDNGNTPNSVFPFFWWPFLKNDVERSVLMIRAMGDA